MKTLNFVSVIISAMLISTAMYAENKTDPNHLATGGYGYLIRQTEQQTLWWSEAAYKVMKDAPLPQQERPTIHLESAKNEWESFILVSFPRHDLEEVNISLSDMVYRKHIIPASAFTIRDVEYVKVTHPTNSYGFAGDWPDPLPLFKKNTTLSGGENNPFWISIKTPKDAVAGTYKGSVTISGRDWSEKIPLTLEVWNFSLPDSPTMRSGFGFNLNNAMDYNNLTTEEEKVHVFDLYMKAFSDYKIAPYNPFLLTPIKEKVTGLDWQGGFYDAKEKHSGKYSYMLVDNSYNYNKEGSLKQLLPVVPSKTYQLDWWAKSAADNQPYVIGVECYDRDGQLIWFENRVNEFVANKEWKGFTYSLGHFQPEIAKVMIRLFPSKRTAIGEGLGTVWFDDVTLRSVDEGANPSLGKNLLASGNFEIDLDKIDIQLDFTAFNKAADKYMKEYGFNSFSCSLKGLGGGTYYSRQGGVFEGFAQGTEEYNRLMERYLKQMQDNLETSGLLGKEYIYWFDEPGEADYPFVYETNAMIKKYAPKIHTFLTEHLPGKDISEVTDISCSVWNNVDDKKTEKILKRGGEYWSYICCGPGAPWINEFIDSDGINFRMWIWGSYVRRLSGVLIWETTYWNSFEATPMGNLQNPWTEAMSWRTSYGLPLGQQLQWGNGDGRLFYPENRDVTNDRSKYMNEAVPSLRLELLRDGMEDYEYLKLLEKLVRDNPKSKAVKAAQLLQIPETIYKDEKTFTKDPRQILKYRQRLAKAISSLL